MIKCSNSTALCHLLVIICRKLWKSEAIECVWLPTKTEVLKNVTNFVGISFSDLVTCLPFGNTVDFAEVQGKHIWAALEFSASAYHEQKGTNFLQVSGNYVCIPK